VIILIGMLLPVALWPVLSDDVVFDNCNRRCPQFRPWVLCAAFTLQASVADVVAADGGVEGIAVDVDGVVVRWLISEFFRAKTR